MASQRGGRRPGAGRPKGSKNAATKEADATIGELARQHGADALAALVEIATGGTSEAARVSAANALLDRGYGKPTQHVDNTSSDGSMSPHGASADAALDAMRRKHGAAEGDT